MRVRSISVRKLFGRFDHTIPLNQDERITIIHGPNGYGKTALLRLVNAAFAFDIDTLVRTPFQMLRVDLDDGSYLEVSGETYRRGYQEELQMRYQLGEGEQPLVSARFNQRYTRSERSDVQERYSAACHELSRVPTAREMLAILAQERPLEDNYLFVDLWLSLVSVDFISVQRLLTPSHDARLVQKKSLIGPDVEERDKLTFKETVTVYAEELRNRLSRLVREEYASKSYELDRNFPTRAVEALSAPAVSEEELQQRLEGLEEKRRRLDNLSIVPSEDIRVDIPASVDNAAARQVLWLYVRDVEDKLAIFENLVKRVSLFQEIINQRLQFKRLKIDAERGFVFESDTGQELPPTALSSGEQHQLVMVYECLFKIEQDALLLIDEPELSLHVSWQVEFLHDLQRIIEIAKFDVVIATHSPQIIHDRWDLTVELQPPSGPPASITSEVPVVEQGAALE